jgi:hypothetical protein
LRKGQKNVTNWLQKSPQLTIVIEGRSKKVRNCAQKSLQLTVVIEGRSKNGTNLVSKISPTETKKPGFFKKPGFWSKKCNQFGDKNLPN